MKIVMLTSLLLLAGCMAHRPDLTQSGVVRIENQVDGAVRVYGISARQVGDELVVSGSVRRAFSGNGPVMPGHLDVKACRATGEWVAAGAAEQTPDSLPMNSSRSATFSVRLPMTATDGTVVRVNYHAGAAGAAVCLEE